MLILKLLAIGAESAKFVPNIISIIFGEKVIPIAVNNNPAIQYKRKYLLYLCNFKVLN